LNFKHAFWALAGQEKGIFEAIFSAHDLLGKPAPDFAAYALI